MIEENGGGTTGDCPHGRRENGERESPMAVHNVRSEASGCTVGGDREYLRDPVGEKLGRVGKMPRLARKQRYRFTNRERESTESVK